MTLNLRTIAIRIIGTKTPRTAEIIDVQNVENSYVSADVSDAKLRKIVTQIHPHFSQIPLSRKSVENYPSFE